MITVVPQASDWNYIADITGDDSWRPAKMRGYFERLENCKYVARPGSLTGMVSNTLSSIAELLKGKEDFRDFTNGHGFNGWLPTCEADPKMALKDPEILEMLLSAVRRRYRKAWEIRSFASIRAWTRTIRAMPPRARRDWPYAAGC